MRCRPSPRGPASNEHPLPCGATPAGFRLHALRRRGRALQGTYTGSDGGAGSAAWGNGAQVANMLTGSGGDDIFYGGDGGDVAGDSSPDGSYADGGSVFNTFEVRETPPVPASLSVPLRAVADWHARHACCHAWAVAPSTQSGRLPSAHQLAIGPHVPLCSLAAPMSVLPIRTAGPLRLPSRSHQRARRAHAHAHMRHACREVQVTTPSMEASDHFTAPIVFMVMLIITSSERMAMMSSSPGKGRQSTTCKAVQGAVAPTRTTSSLVRCSSRARARDIDHRSIGLPTAWLQSASLSPEQRPARLLPLLAHPTRS